MTATLSLKDKIELGANIRTGEVCLLLDVTLDWFYRNRQALIDEHGFPPPERATGHPRWDSAAVIEWKRRNVPDALRRPANENAPTPEDWTGKLLGRLEGAQP